MTHDSRQPPGPQAAPADRQAQAVERTFQLGVFNPAEKPWVFRVTMKAVYEDPLYHQTATHRWFFDVPGDVGYFPAEPWTIPVIAVPRWAVVRWDGEMKIRGATNVKIRDLYSQSSFLTLSAHWSLASVGVVADQVDWDRVAKVVVDLFRSGTAGERLASETMVFELLEVQGELRVPPPQYFSYQVPVGAPTTYLYQIHYYDRDGTEHSVPPVASSESWLVLPPVLG